MAALIPDNNNLFINPYNFVSTTSRVDRTVPSQGNKTGYISCTLKVKDMLALPDRNKEYEKAPRHYDFYKINGNPIIPGSEIRGCIRSVFEAVTQSCFSVINNNVLTCRLSRPESANGVIPGVLKFENDSWTIYKADKYGEKYIEKIEDKPDVEREWIKFGRNAGFSKSYFYVSDYEPEYICSEEDMECFEELIGIFIRNNEDDKKFSAILKEVQKSLYEKKDVAIFFRIKNGEMNYFSPAQISRQMFRNTVSGLLNEHAGICNEENGYCPTCRLFGTLGKGNPVASRVRFSDAAEKQNVRIHSEYLNLPELSTPKITSAEFYSSIGTQSKDVRFWNYDSPCVELNGRKFYYHNKPVSENELGPRSIATKPVCENSEFKFKVYFEKISSTELKQLLWVLSLGENEPNSLQMHKIGYGRPVGYGSVKITVDEIVERKIENGTYSLEKNNFIDYGISDAVFSEQKALSDLKLISKYNYVIDKKVSYPIADDGKNRKNSKAAHNWFSSNRTKNRTVRYVLPKLSPKAEDLYLPAMKAPDGNFTLEQYKPKPSGNNSNFNFAKFEINKTYTAEITGNMNMDNGKTAVFIKVLGEKARVVPRDWQLDKHNFNVGDKVTVIFKGKNKNNDKFPDFWIK